MQFKKYEILLLLFLIKQSVKVIRVTNVFLVPYAMPQGIGRSFGIDDPKQLIVSSELSEETISCRNIYHNRVLFVYF